MYLKRKVDEFLNNWKNDEDKSPLIIRGCRQVGKTESILHFAYENYKSVIEINFARDIKYKQIIADGYDVNSIIKNITLINPNISFIENDTLIFFDEITDFPEIATSLKFFKIDGRYDVICSGSLLGLNYKKIESNSVGYKIDYIMHSLDFEEFLWAKGYNDNTVNDMFNHMVNMFKFNELEMNLYHSLFLDYNVTGGMPAAVRRYIEKGTFEGVLNIQKQLIEDYKEDIRKYAEGVDQTRILNVFNSIPSQLAKENKKFQLSKVASNAKYRDYRGCVEWIKDSGIVNVSYCLNFPELPLKGNVDTEKFKLYFCDTGLLISLLDEESSDDLRTNKNLGVYKGGIYENMIGESLVKAGYELFYYRKDDSTLEEDFFIRNKDYLIPIEVKSTTGSSKSLKTLIHSDKYADIKFGLKFSKSNLGISDNIFTIPYFCSFLLKRFNTIFDYNKYLDK